MIERSRNANGVSISPRPDGLINRVIGPCVRPQVRRSIARAGLGVRDLAEARVMGPFEKRGNRAVAAQVAGQDALARAAFKAAVHHSRSSIIASADFPNSANPASTSPPW